MTLQELSNFLRKYGQDAAMVKTRYPEGWEVTLEPSGVSTCGSSIEAAMLLAMEELVKERADELQSV